MQIPRRHPHAARQAARRHRGERRLRAAPRRRAPDVPRTCVRCRAAPHDRVRASRDRPSSSRSGRAARRAARSRRRRAVRNPAISVPTGRRRRRSGCSAVAVGRRGRTAAPRRRLPRAAAECRNGARRRRSTRAGRLSRRRARRRPRSDVAPLC